VFSVRFEIWALKINSCMEGSRKIPFAFNYCFHSSNEFFFGVRNVHLGLAFMCRECAVYNVHCSSLY
jgi:hypothetical protein